MEIDLYLVMIVIDLKNFLIIEFDYLAHLKHCNYISSILCSQYQYYALPITNEVS